MTTSSRPPEATWASLGPTERLDFHRYRLRIDGGPQRLFESRAILIGASPDNDLVVEAPTVSRLHARLEYDGQGYLLTDLGSRNGTWVDGLRVREAYLGPSARLRLGDALVDFALDDQRVAVELTRGHRLGPLIGRSAPMRELFALIARAAPSPVSVLIEGEEGTGKELVAEVIHAHSDRRERPFVVFDCAALSAERVDEELFGHVRGGAQALGLTREGAIGQASGGTLFLDEVHELPLETQARLLRALESGRTRAVGSDASRPVEARVITATSRPLSREVEAGNFRSDLHLRLAVVTLRLPALRHRAEDIPLLVDHFLQAHGRASGRPHDATDAPIGWETMRRLQEHSWPGNVRELRLAVERALTLSGSGRVDARHLAPSLDARTHVEGALEGERLALTVDVGRPFKEAKAQLLDLFETRYWRRLLEASEGNVSEAARRGGIHRKSLEYILKKIDPGGV